MLTELPSSTLQSLLNVLNGSVDTSSLCAELDRINFDHYIQEEVSVSYSLLNIAKLSTNNVYNKSVGEFMTVGPSLLYKLYNIFACHLYILYHAPDPMFHFSNPFLSSLFISTLLSLSSQ